MARRIVKYEDLDLEAKESLDLFFQTLRSSLSIFAKRAIDDPEEIISILAASVIKKYQIPKEFIIDLIDEQLEE